MEDPVKMIDGLRCISTQLIDEGYSEIDNESTMSLDCWQYEFQDQGAFDGDDAYGWSDDEWKGSSLELGYSPNPISQEEIDRWDMMHFIFAQASDGYLHVAPINCYPQRILDIGCRTGNWSIEMADAYPSAEVIGVDTEPIQPILVPPNLSFEIDGLEDIWNFSGSFDYIHARLLAGRINDWPWLVQQCFEHCNHGGWVEFQEIDPLNSFAELICQPAGNSQVQSKHLGPILAHWMSEVGFTNIQIIKRSRRDTARGDLISDEIHTLLNSIDVYIIFGQKP